MKRQQQPTPAVRAQSTRDTPPGSFDAPGEPNRDKTWGLRRHIFRKWTPQSPAEARDILEDCMTRAAALSKIFERYAWGDEVNEDNLRFSLEMLSDLLSLGYGMIEWWDAEEMDTLPSPE